MKVVVTGACGFVGTHLTAHLRSEGDEVIATDNHPGEDHRRHGARTLDATDAHACRHLLAEIKPDAVYHLAGMAFGPDADRDFNSALRVNVGAVDAICRAISEECPDAKLLVVSSAEVYGRSGAHSLPFTEEASIKPMNSYGLTKQMAELVAERYQRVKQQSIVIARAFNHIGPGQRSDFVVPSFVSQIAEIVRQRTAPRLQVGNLASERDFTDVRDIVRGYRLAVLQGTGTYNFCSGKAVSIQEILDTLCELAGVSIEISVDPQRVRSAEVSTVVGSNTKAQRELGWTPVIELRTSLRDSLAAVVDDGGGIRR